LLVGSNGETLRSFFFDRGIMSRWADREAAAVATQRYWQGNLRADLKPAELAAMPPQFAAFFGEGLAGQAKRFADLGAAKDQRDSLLSRLDRFYLDQRVRHFIGNGLTLYGLSTSWRTPFLSIPWVAVAGELPRGWKFGSNWHRHAIHGLCPALLDFPEDRVASRMARRAPLFYWHWRRRRQPVVPYVDYQRLVATPVVLALLADHASAIEDLLPRSAVIGLIDQFRAGERGLRSLSILTTLALWRWEHRG
jgi:asparagine synthase (glutamine-hydrolysing)